MDIQGWVSAAATIGFGVYQSFYAKRAVVLQEKAMRGQALAVEVEKAESWVKRHWRKSVPLGVMLACWVPYFATPRYPIDYFMGWGSLGDRAWVVIDTSKLMQEKPNRNPCAVA